MQTRPILDRVKVALFDWLGSLLAEPGRLPAVAVLDLFAGGGSLGIEALSRGAASCVFVEIEPQALRCLRRNIETLDLAATSKVLAVPAGLLRKEALIGAAGTGFGLMFLDPPYPMSGDLSADSPMMRTLDHLAGAAPVTSEALLVWRHPIDAAIPDELPGGWVSLGRRTWGRMAVTMFQSRQRETT
jgi:16S rRNA (guanine966-N2)-methyltransferase